MTRGDRIIIIRGAYHGYEAEVVRKVPGTNDALFCTIEGMAGLCMVFEGEIEAGDVEVTR